MSPADDPTQPHRWPAGKQQAVSAPLMVCPVMFFLLWIALMWSTKGEISAGESFCASAAVTAITWALLTRPLHKPNR